MVWRETFMNQSRAMRIVAYPVTAILMAALAAVVLFAACFVYETEKKVAFWAAAAIVAICATPHFRRRLREHCSIFFLLVTAYILLAGASTFYAYAPKFALSEFSRLLAAYAVFLAVFSFVKTETLPNAAAILCGATSLLSVIHLDAASGGLFAHDIMRKFQIWTGGYLNDANGNLLYGYNEDRLMGLFGNSNSMATMCAIGIFLAAYLLLRARGPRRLLPSVALIIHTVTFLMCVSLGATLSLGITVLLVLLLLRGAYNRVSFLMITLETLLVSGVVAIFSFPHMGINVPSGYWVLIYCLVGALVLFGLDWLLRPRFVLLLCKKIKTLAIGIVCLVVLIGIAAGVALTQTCAASIQSNDTLYRRFYPGDGACELTLDLEGQADIWIGSASVEQIIKGSVTTLVNGAYEGTVNLEIPEDTVDVQLRIIPADGSEITVNRITYKGTEKSGELPTGYRWIPEEMIRRFQGITTNHSAMQRIVFMQDGLKMWKQTPVFGRGLGGYENGLASVQSFFYETKYAHNHYVQVLCDLGVVGLLLFVSMLGLAIKSLWALRRQEENGQTLYPALLGAVLMFAIHGGLEISPSVAEVSILMFGVFGIVAHIAPAPALWKDHGKIIAWTGSIGLALLAAAYGFLLVQNMRAAEIVKQETVTTSQLKQCVEMDAFESDDYRLTYVVAAMSIQDEEVYQQADQYADELQMANSNAVGSYLTEYYLHRGDYDKAEAASEKFLTYTRSNPNSWNQQFQTFATALQYGVDEEGTNRIIQMTKDTYARLVEVNQEQLDELPLDDANSSYLTKVLSSERTFSERMYNLLCDSYYAPDSNGDGCADNVAVRLGNVQWEENGAFTAEEESVVQYRMLPSQTGSFVITIETSTPDSVTFALLDHELDYDNTDNGIDIRFAVTDTDINEGLDLRLYLKPGCVIQRVSGWWDDNVIS